MRSVVCCIALAICAIAPSVRADDAAADSAERKKRDAAKRYVDAGLVAQEQGDHDTAVGLYEKAYALVPHPTLLFNIGQAHRLAKHAALAIEHYQRFLAETTDAKLADEARGWIAQLEAAAESERAAARAAAERAAAARVAAQRAALARAAADDAAEAPVQIQAPAASAERHPGRALRIAGASVAIAGALAAGGGVAFGLRARRLSDELTDPDTPYDPERFRSGERAERTMYILYAAGGAAIATGAVMFLVGRRGTGSPRTARVVPAWSGGAAGLALTGGF
jgi:tetratricopeptide (TPR) repeat protein